jgi:hypothetical protein
MSNIPMPERQLKDITSLMRAIPKAIETYHKTPQATLGLVKQLLQEFTDNPIITSLTGPPPSQVEETSPLDHASELASIKSTLLQLTKAVTGL